MRLFITRIDKGSFLSDPYLEMLSRKAKQIKLVYDCQNGDTPYTKVIMVFENEPDILKEDVFKGGCKNKDNSRIYD